MTLEEFIKEMEKVRYEKYDKYKDTWKSCPINHIIYKLNKQIESLDNSDKDRGKRIAIHICNYAYFLHQRLKYDN